MVCLPWLECKVFIYCVPAATPVPRTVPGTWQKFKYLFNIEWAFMNLSELQAKMLVSIEGRGDLFHETQKSFWEQRQVKKHSAEFQPRISEHQWPRLGEISRKITQQDLTKRRAFLENRRLLRGQPPCNQQLTGQAPAFKSVVWIREHTLQLEPQVKEEAGIYWI